MRASAHFKRPVAIGRKPVNKASSLLKNCYEFWLCKERAGNILDGLKNVVNFSALGSPGWAADGTLVNAGAGNDYWTNSSHNSGGLGSGGYTFIARCNKAGGAPSGQEETLFGATQATDLVEFVVQSDGNLNDTHAARMSARFGGTIQAFLPSPNLIYQIGVANDVAVTVDQTGLVTIYLNGATASVQRASGPDNWATGRWSLGGRFTSTNRFNGKIEFAALYSRAFSVAEIDQFFRRVYADLLTKPAPRYGPASAIVGLAGFVSAQASASGALSIAVPIAAISVAAVSAQGGLSVSMPLAGSAAVQVAASGDLVLRVDLAASAVANSAAQAALLMVQTLAGSAQAQTAASADLDPGSAGLGGAASANAAASGSVTLSFTLSGAAIVSALAAADLDIGTDLLGAALANAAASGALVQAVPLAGNASARVSGAGNLTQIVPLSSVAASVVAASGAVLVSVDLSASALALVSAAGDLDAAGSGLSGQAAANAAAGGSLVMTIPLSGAAVASALATADFAQSTLPLIAAYTLIAPALDLVVSA